jgi:hypothetical protein
VQHYSGTGGAQDRTVSPYSDRHRARVEVDTRVQTAYGTVRTFEAIQMQNENNAESFNVTRAFIQFSGFTFGRTKSFTDTVGALGDGSGYANSLFTTQNHRSTGANGINTLAYTWEMGNGITLTFGMDEKNTKSLPNLGNANVITAGAEPTNSYHGVKWPDVFAAFKVAQAWGEFDVSFIAHDVSALYYTNTLPGGCPAGLTGTTQCAHPTDKIGWAVLTGIWIKLPQLSAGSNAGAFFNYSQGASAFGGGSISSPNMFDGWNGLAGNFSNVSLGWITDGVYCNPGVAGCGSIQLTTAWTAGGFLTYYFAPTFSATVYGAYASIEYNSTVVNNRWFCGGTGAAQSVVVNAAVACDPGFVFWTVGGIANWYPVKGLRFAVDVLYTFIESAYAGSVVTLNKTTGARPSGAYTAKDQGILAVTFRAQRGWGGD